MAGIPTPKPKHLPREEFSSKKFRTVRTPYFSVKVKLNNGAAGRIGVVAGKAAGKTAIKRNFLKRQVRAGLRRAIVPGEDILVIVSPIAGGLTKKNLHTELVRAIKKAQS